MTRCVLAALFLIAGLQAHDFYVLPAQFHVQKGATLRIAFHNGDSFPASEVAPKIARLKDPSVIGKGGTAPILGLKEAGKETIGEVLVPAQGSLVIAVRTIPNFIELEAAKFADYLKEEGLDQIIAWRKEHGEASKPGRERYSKYAKSLLQSGEPDGFYQHPMDFPIEIIPLADPYQVKPGGKLAVRVLFRGKAAQGLQLETAWSSGSQGKTQVIGRTDADGRIEVPILKAGLWRLHSLKMERCTDPKAADWESYWASLTFEVR